MGTGHRLTLIFDFDGTLVDSLEPTLLAYNRLAPRFNVKPIERADLPRLRTLGARAAMREHRVSFWKLPWLVRSMRKALHAQVDALQAIEGIPEALRALAARGDRLCILSSNSNENIERFLSRAELRVFEHVVGGSSLFGKARALTRLLRALELERASALYVGDELRDVEAAHAVGIGSIAVTWGYAARDTLAAAQPTHLVDRPSELLSLG
jgi:phosphoglycolate phosphatase